MNFELYRLQSDGPLAQLVEQFPFKEWVAGRILQGSPLLNGNKPSLKILPLNYQKVRYSQKK